MKTSVLIITVLLLGVVSTVEATQCGGTYYYFSDNEEHPVGTTHNDPVGAVLSAHINCCAASTITFNNVDTGAPETHTIDSDGMNALCP